MYRIIKKCSQFITLSGHALYIRHVSALYISGDKASENYVTIQPYMDFDETFRKEEQLQHSIEKRKLTVDIKKVKEMYSTYSEGRRKIDKLEDEREIVAKKLKGISKAAHKDENLIQQLKEKGKGLKSDLKAIKTDFYPIEDEFIQAFLHLPNFLHPQCPEGDNERVLYRSPQKLLEANKSHLEHDDLIHFIDDTRYYMLMKAAKFDLKIPQALARYFLDKGGFTQTANPDFTRCVLLEANATPLDTYYKVLEANLQNKLNPAYLTGGGSFESFLGAVTKLCVYPSVLPLKFVSCGRIYERINNSNTSNLFTAIQNNAVQTFVATTDQQKAEEQMDNILNLCVDFYKIFNVNFRVVYVNAAQLSPSESLRAQIEIYSPYEKRYIYVGRVSNYNDFVSKRILFTMREQNNYHFLHLVGGPVLYTSRLIATLIEHGNPLDYQPVLEALKLNTAKKNGFANAMNEFKSLFK